jgi:alpha-D-xyloside xylohydrolase
MKYPTACHPLPESNVPAVSGAAIELSIGGWTQRIEAWCPGVFRLRAKPEPSAWDESGVFLLPQSVDSNSFKSWSSALKSGICGPSGWVELENGLLRWGVSKCTTLGQLPLDDLSFRAKEVHRWVPSKADRPTVLKKTIDGQKAMDHELVAVWDRDAWTARIGLSFSENEALFGLGGLEEGIFNYRGSRQYLYPHNLRLPIPHLVSSRGYSILVHSGSGMIFDGSGVKPFLEIDTADQLDLFILLGPGFDTLVGHFRRLTGQATPLPEWALGYIQSKEHYHTQEELLEVVREYQRRDIPLAMIVQDWKYWPEGQWGQKSFDASRYPDPNGLVRELHAQAVRLMISLWPNSAPGCPNHRELEIAGALLPDGSTYNAFSLEARRIFWSQIQSAMGAIGIDAWWSDSSEPFTADWEGAHRRPPAEAYRHNLDFAARYLDPTKAAAYGLEHARMIWEGMNRDRAGDPVLNLTRSAWPGQQQFGAVPWSGDISARWDVLRKQIAEALSFCVTGMPYWTVDIGAFFTGRHQCFHRWTGLPPEEKTWFWEGDYEAGCDDLGYRELYVRWFQFGAFLPLFRAHGTDTPREIWRFGSPGEPFYDALVDTIKLRYQLMPYFSEVMRDVVDRNGTWLRMLAFDFSDDPKALGIADQFCCGREFMVCPITQPFLYGPDSKPLGKQAEMGRDVYFPAGGNWICFWSGEEIPGGQSRRIACPLNQIPLFKKAF